LGSCKNQFERLINWLQLVRLVADIIDPAKTAG
jgi:hypothetical protein